MPSGCARGQYFLSWQNSNYLNSLHRLWHGVNGAVCNAFDETFCSVRDDSFLKYFCSTRFKKLFLTDFVVSSARALPYFFFFCNLLIFFLPCTLLIKLRIYTCFLCWNNYKSWGNFFNGLWKKGFMQTIFVHKKSTINSVAKILTVNQYNHILLTILSKVLIDILAEFRYVDL